MRMDLYVKELHERIAALEAALRGLLRVIETELPDPPKGDPWFAVVQRAQALTSSEGAGELGTVQLPEMTEDQRKYIEQAQRVQNIDMTTMIPSPTSAAEDREEECPHGCDKHLGGNGEIREGIPGGWRVWPCPLHGDHHGEGE